MMRVALFQNHEEDSLKRGIQVSLIIHTVGLLFALAQNSLFREKPKTYIPSLKVDIVALPDLLKNDAKKAHQRELQKELSQILAQAEKMAQKIQKEQSQIKSKTTSSTAKPHEISIQHSRQNQTQEAYSKNRQALDRLKLLAKIQENITDAPHGNTPHTVLIKGNRLSQGSSLSEDAQESSQQSYLDLLKDRLHENFSLPPWISRQNFSAQVEIRIDAQGHLIHIQFIKPSGNPQFDDIVKKTIQITQPFPLPPEEVRFSLQKNGILIGFPL